MHPANDSSIVLVIVPDSIPPTVLTLDTQKLLSRLSEVFLLLSSTERDKLFPAGNMQRNRMDASVYAEFNVNARIPLECIYVSTYVYTHMLNNRETTNKELTFS